MSSGRGSKRFDAIPAELKAERVGERFEHDATSGTVPEEASVEWARAWTETVDGAPHRRSLRLVAGASGATGEGFSQAISRTGVPGATVDLLSDTGSPMLLEILV